MRPVTFSKPWTTSSYQVHYQSMVVLAVVLLGWCLLSLPVCLVMGRLLRESHLEAEPDPVAARPGAQRERPRSTAMA